ncbi:uncharacterized protein Tco_0150454 [Tanacetum coccineum]
MLFDNTNRTTLILKSHRFRNGRDLELVTMGKLDIYSVMNNSDNLKTDSRNSGKPFLRIHLPFPFGVSPTLLPVMPGYTPKFSQLYIYDPANEIENRIGVVSSRDGGSSSSNNKMDRPLTKDLKTMLDRQNPLVKQFRMASIELAMGVQKVKIRLIGARLTDRRQYNLPTAKEVAALIVGDFDSMPSKRDIIVHENNDNIKRNSELHVSYLPLQYPMLFPYGENGYRTDVLHYGFTDETPEDLKKYVTRREWFAYRIQDRPNVFSTILSSKRLFQQFLVDGYTMVEAERMLYIRNQQSDLRCETYSRMLKAAESGENKKCGSKVVLPSSFTGSPRYMMQNYLDAMAMFKWYGYPDLFITFTCNPKWPEITRFLKKRGLKSKDRPDVTTRVFKIKLDRLIKDIKEMLIFGQVKAEVYTIEFQKRGLPHCHLCVWLETENKLRFPVDIDRCISAKIPNKDEDPELYQLVKEFMMHGPCGPEHRSCPCMVDNKCSKKFPKKFNEETFIDESGYAIYSRSENGKTIKKQGVDLDNRFVVPYNPTLLRRYQAHINVEWCNQFGSIKYLFKYINKGPDRVTTVVEDEEKDEINDFYDCRYLSACEAAWRIFKFDIHHRFPAVERLPFHLPDEQTVVFYPSERIDFQIEKASCNTTKFLEWMETNKTDTFSQTLLYVQFPKYYVWNKSDKKWTKRKQGQSIGRIHHVLPNWGELFYLRMLLNKVRGATGWDSFKEYDNVVYNTYKEACFARGLMDGDKEYIDGIIEASQWGMGEYLRKHFVMLIMSKTMSRPEVVWEKTWRLLAEDVLEIESRSKIIQDALLSNSKSLKNIVNMPFPDSQFTMENYNRLIYDELKYNIPDLINHHKALYRSLTLEQKGKTFLYKTLTAALRSKGEIVLNVASSGIAALLLDGGRTAHSRFAIPININEDSLCTITAYSDLADLIRETKLIIWDEAPMVNKHSFEAFDKTLRDFATDSIKEFAEWILSIGDGKIETMIHETYENWQQQLWDPTYFQDRAILAPTHEEVDKVNARMMSKLSCKETVYYSSDTILDIDVDFNYNESLLQILRLGIKNIEAKIISGGKVGDVCSIPRMKISPTDKKMPFQLNRRQFPVSI